MDLPAVADAASEWLDTAANLQWPMLLVCLAASRLGLIAFDCLAIAASSRTKKLESTAKHLDELSRLDKGFIEFNRWVTAMGAYHVFQFLYYSPNVSRDLDGLSLVGTLLAFFCCFIVCDLTYSLFHRALHLRSVYKFVHKHHHRQAVPSRGNLDAINVHPIEYIIGEYNLLLAMHIVSKLMPLHAVAGLAYITGCGALATLNHTRSDLIISLPLPSWLSGAFDKGKLTVPLYDVRAHDMHHRVPTVNYGQFTMLWDRLMGTYRENDAVSSQQVAAKAKAQ